MRYEVKFGTLSLTAEAENIVEAIELVCRDENLPVSDCTSVKEVTVRYGRKTIDIWEFFDQDQNLVAVFGDKKAADEFKSRCEICVYAVKKRAKA